MSEQINHSVYVRYVKHDDRNGMVLGLKFIGPFADHAAAVKWIETHEVTYREYEDEWVDNDDEPVEVYVVVDKIPIVSPT